MKHIADPNQKNVIFCVFFILLSSFVLSCHKEKKTPPVAQSSNAEITAVKLLKDTTNIAGSVVIQGDSVKITVATATDLSSLTLKVTISANATISPADNTLQDFTHPVSYTITAQDGTKKIYIVAVILDKLRNVVFVGGRDNHFYAYNAASGAVLWNYAGTGSFEYASPARYKEMVYAGNTAGVMYAFNDITGQVAWNYTTASAIISSPVVVDGIVYFGSTDNYLYALDAQTGALKWKYNSSNPIAVTPVVNNGKIYFSNVNYTNDATYYAIDATTGNLQWQYTDAGNHGFSNAALTNGVLCFGSGNGYFYGLNSATGALNWKYATPDKTSFIAASPVAANGIVYAGTYFNLSFSPPAGSLYAINVADGSLAWTSLNNVGINLGGTIDGANLYITANDENIYDINITNGTILWKKSITPNGALPAVKDGVIYSYGWAGPGEGSDQLYALSAATGNIIWQIKVKGGGTARPYVVGTDGI